jgi:hypothetical protein
VLKILGLSSKLAIVSDAPSAITVDPWATLTGDGRIVVLTGTARGVPSLRLTLVQGVQRAEGYWQRRSADARQQWTMLLPVHGAVPLLPGAAKVYAGDERVRAVDLGGVKLFAVEPPAQSPASA